MSCIHRRIDDTNYNKGVQNMSLNHLGTKTIETQRLILRRFEFTDSESMFDNWISDSNVQKSYGELPCKTIDDVEKILNKWISSYCNSEFYRWAIILKETNTNIGQIAFYIVDSKNQRADVEYCISKSYWGNSFATEALEAVIEYSLEEIKFNRVQAFYRSENISSGKVMQKAGMKYEGTFKQYLFHDNYFHDCIMYAITREDWIKD